MSTEKSGRIVIGCIVVCVENKKEKRNPVDRCIQKQEKKKNFRKTELQFLFNPTNEHKNLYEENFSLTEILK